MRRGAVYEGYAAICTWPIPTVSGQHCPLLPKMTSQGLCWLQSGLGEEDKMINIILHPTWKRVINYWNNLPVFVVGSSPLRITIARWQIFCQIQNMHIWVSSVTSFALFHAMKPDRDHNDLFWSYKHKLYIIYSFILEVDYYFFLMHLLLCILILTRLYLKTS